MVKLWSVSGGTTAVFCLNRSTGLRTSRRVSFVLRCHLYCLGILYIWSCIFVCFTVHAETPSRGKLGDGPEWAVPAKQVKMTPRFWSKAAGIGKALCLSYSSLMARCLLCSLSTNTRSITKKSDFSLICCSCASSTNLNKKVSRCFRSSSSAVIALHRNSVCG